MTERTLTAPVRAPAGEEEALATSAIVVQRENRRRWTMKGPATADVLNGLVTNDVSTLTADSGCYAAALTPKGKVIADLRIFARAEDFLVDAPAAAGEGWSGVLRKYVNPRLSRYEEITANTADVAIAGPRAAAVLADALAADAVALESLQPHAHVTLPIRGGALIVRSPELTETAFDVVVTAEAASEISGRFEACGATIASMDTWEVARIARGWPAWGKDMDENTLAQEASLDAFNAISYTKGCYTGQETVARVHFRGHVNRYLRRAHYVAEAVVPSGAALLDDSGKDVGDVRSSAVSERHGGIAVVMLRREVTDGATVDVRWDAHSARLRVMDY